MPVVVIGGGTTYLSLLPEAPTATESATAFPLTANNFFNSIYIMVGNVNLTIRGTSATDLTVLPVPPQALDATFANDADTFLASLPGMITGVNAIISTLLLSCSAITALPTTPSRGSDPADFATRAASELAALPTLRTQLNDFITALIAYDPAVPPATLGNSATPDSNHGLNADWQHGQAYQATSSFTATRIFLHGDPGSSATFNYRLCIYAATSETVWSGALLGQTAEQTSLGTNELHQAALLAPVSIVAGNWYALTVQSSTGSGSGPYAGGLSGGSSRFFTDTYSDGAASTAGASSLNSPIRSICIFAAS